jgi:hypothetical protein
VQIAERRHRFRLNQRETDLSIAGNVIRNIDPEDFNVGIKKIRF